MREVDKPKVGQVYLIVKETPWLLLEPYLVINKVNKTHVRYDYNSSRLDYFKGFDAWQELIENGTLVLASPLMQSLF